MRLTDEELSTLERDAIAGLYGADFAIVIDVVAEIRDRRAADREIQRLADVCREYFKRNATWPRDTLADLFAALDRSKP